MHYINLSQTANPSFQHKINQSAVFHYIREHGPAYKNQIAIALGISLPSVTRSLDALIERGFAELVEYRKTDQSRVVPFYRAALNAGLVVYMDFLKGAISGRTLDDMFPIVPFKRDGSRPVTEFLVSIIDAYFEEHLRRPVSVMRSLCIGFPGIVDVQGGKVRRAIYHPELEGVPIRDALAERYGCSVFIDNVVNLAAYANYCEFAKAYSNIISCDIGLEIGAGLLIGGAVYRGERFKAGETGFCIDDLRRPTENYKRTHTFRSLCREMTERLPRESEQGQKEDEAYYLREVERLFELAHRGDPVALSIMDGYVGRIALMLNKIESILDPSKIVIGGDVCQMPHSEEVFLKPLVERLRPISAMPDDVCYSKHGLYVSLQGAGEMALANYLSAVFPYRMEEDGAGAAGTE